ncbi:outer membrane beta-barrel protein [Massilia oculi]|uniref:Outer membrane beta-barrel protein n=1 Tax=Massilia hydrophila TaxID=3044279 RepID=A0ABS7YFM6_9BURK|nr:outer membrane beta-barrel protein [Massilia oculi]MCA1857736.1 outer membrane beta-barrel protein [Massilia oculi]
MFKVLATLAAGMMGIALAGAAQAAEPARPAAPAYAGAAVTGVDYVGAATKASPKVFAGYHISKSLALEGGAVDLKKGYGMYIAVKPVLPLTDKLALYGKVGVAQVRRPAALPSQPTQPAPLGRKTDTGAYGAFGLQYSITPNTAISAEYERYGKDKPSGAKPDMWTLALNFFF